MENQASAPPIEKGWVKVTNLAPTTTPEELVNLFGFCGYVSGVTLADDPQTNQRIALIEFWDKNAAVTGCLLSSAMIQNQPIHVELYLASDTEKQHMSESQTKSTGPPPQDIDPAAKQSRTATVIRLLASGLVMAGDVKDKAIAWDTGNLSIIQKAEVLGLNAKSNVEEINRKYHITDTVEELVTVAEQKLLQIKSNIEANPNFQIAKSKAVEIDNQYGITSTAKNIFEMAKSTATDFGQDVLSEVKKQSNQNKT
jgi:RNA recognition motif-containing protein